MCIRDRVDAAEGVRGIWLYLYVVIGVWRRKVVAWDVAEREDAAVAADLVSQACLRERISKGQKKPLGRVCEAVTALIPIVRGASW